MATSEKPNLDAPSSAPPRRKIFDLESQVPASDAESSPESVNLPAPATETTTPAAPPVSAKSPAPRTRSSKAPAASAPPVAASPENTSGAVGKKRGPKPSAEPLERTTLKLRGAVINALDTMLEDAPRHVKKQDLMDFIFTDFFARHPTLPAELKKKPKKD